jgi:hypothetical protein
MQKDHLVAELLYKKNQLFSSLVTHSRCKNMNLELARRRRRRKKHFFVEKNE